MSVTIGLVVVNIIVFLILEFIGDTLDVEFMIRCGAISVPDMVLKGEYWRLLSATFMHWGFSHLLNNMIMLGSAGQILEKAMGKWKYLFLYLISGVGGSALSFGQMLYTGEYKVSAGASGAIFGIIGALCWIVILHKGKYKTLTGKGLLIMVVLCLFYGISTGDVDNWGHIGGLIMGFLISIIFYRRNVKNIDFGEQNLYTYTYDENITCEVEDED